jgi:hypothetical protein
VDEGVRARVDARLRREFDASGCDLQVCLFYEVELLGQVGKEGCDLRAREVEECGQGPS